MGVLYEATALEMRIPEDLSVTGFDNLPITDIMTPSITTVDIPSVEMGERAAAVLVKKLSVNDPIKSQCLPAPLIIRQTTGAIE